jgi:serine phosphatase RsbU (regulator of sigma subunit)
MAYRRSFAQLRPGEVLLIYSDGLTERKRRLPPGTSDAAPVALEPEPAAEAEQEEFGTERLIRIASEHAHRPARDLLAAILTEVRDFGAGEPWEDDATLLVVRRLPAHEFKPKRTLGTVLSFDQARIVAAKKPADGK